MDVIAYHIIKQLMNVLHDQNTANQDKQSKSHKTPKSPEFLRLRLTTTNKQPLHTEHILKRAVIATRQLTNTSDEGRMTARLLSVN